MQSITTLLTEIGSLSVKVVRSVETTTVKAKPVQYKDEGKDVLFEADLGGLMPPWRKSMYTSHSRCNAANTPCSAR